MKNLQRNISGRRGRARIWFAALLIGSSCNAIVHAQTLSRCDEWTVVDNGEWGGWNLDPQVSVDVWAPAHDRGKLPTGLSPVALNCIRNAKTVRGAAPNDQFFFLQYERANWDQEKGQCAPGWISWGGGPIYNRATDMCRPFLDARTAEGANLGASCPKASVNDPINPANGNVYRIETDVEPLASGLEFSRTYNSQPGGISSLGIRWAHSFSASIAVIRSGTEHRKFPHAAGGGGASADPSTSSMHASEEAACALGFEEIKEQDPDLMHATAAYEDGACRLSSGGSMSVHYPGFPPPSGRQIIRYELSRSDGKILRFDVSNGVVTPPVGSRLQLQGISGGFKVTTSDDTVETYNPAGRLTSIRRRGGITYTLSYGPNMELVSAVDSFGHQLTFGYDVDGGMISVTDPAGRVVRYAYDGSGRLATVTQTDETSTAYLYENTSYPLAMTGVIDEMGNRIATWGYDSLGRGTSVSEANFAPASIVYNGDRSATVTDSLGAVRVFNFARRGDLLLSTGIAGSRMPGCDVGAAVEYSDSGFMTAQEDYNGNITTYVHDARGLETSRTEASGTPLARTVTTAWHSTLRKPTLITEPGKTTTFTYDTDGNALTSTVTDTDSSGAPSRTSTFSYDSFGRVLTIDGPRTDVTDVTTFVYNSCTTGDGCGSAQSATNALGQVKTFNSYNDYGDLLSSTDPNGTVTTLTYDTRRRVKTQTVGAEMTSFDYWPSGKVRRVTVPDMSYLLFSYDIGQRLTSVTDGEGNRVDYTLDAVGNRTAEQVRDPSGALARMGSRVFNSLGQLWKDISSAGTPAVTTTYSHDGEGNVTTTSAPIGRVATQIYDELLRVKQVTDAVSGTTAFGYDDADNLVSVTDPRGLTTSYTYDGFGDLVQQTSPDAGSTSMTYDASGNLKISTDARGVESTRTYDALDRLMSLTYPDRVITFTYDSSAGAVGRLSGAADSNHLMSWTYDSLGRIASASQSIGGVARTMFYSYENGNLATITTPSGQVIRYEYANSRVRSVSVNNINVLNDVLYEPLGQPRNWVWANGTIAARTHDLDGRLTQYDTGGELTEIAYDDASRITSAENVTASVLSKAYGYDSLDRLTSSSGAFFSETFGYDANGNRTVETRSIAGQQSVLSHVMSTASNRLANTSGSHVNTYSFDLMGNTTTESNSTRPVFAEGTTAVDYAYNALSQRISKSGQDGATYFVYDEAGHLLGEYGSGGALIQETVWLGELPVATVRPSVNGGVDLYYVHTDQLGTPRKVTRPADNALMWRWDPTSFGIELANENPAGLGTFLYNLRFPGQYFDAESGVHYNYFRDYDPATGRYSQSDPIGLKGGLNTFAYVGGNPVSLTDPEGLEYGAAFSTDLRHMGWKPPGPPVPPYLPPELRRYICKVLKECGGNLMCMRNRVNDERLGRSTGGEPNPKTWHDPVLKPAENFAVAAAPAAPIYHYTSHSRTGVTIYQFVYKPIFIWAGGKSTEPSWDSWRAGMAGVYWYEKGGTELQKWCECSNE